MSTFLFLLLSVDFSMGSLELVGNIVCDNHNVPFPSIKLSNVEHRECSKNQQTCIYNEALHIHVDPIYETGANGNENECQCSKFDLLYALNISPRVIQIICLEEKNHCSY